MSESGDIHAEAPERYETALAYLRCGVVSRPEAERLWGLPAGFRDRVAEERDRAGWIEGVRRRLGLVAEVHRCRVWQSVGLWHWWCLRDSCGGASYNRPSQTEAFAEALAHARSFVPQPLEPGPWTELDVLAFEAIGGQVLPAGKWMPWLDLTGWGPLA